MKKIIIHGPSGVGKTTTLGMVYDRIENEITNLILKKQIGQNTKDFIAVFECRNKKIVLCTVGDYDVVAPIVIELGSLISCDVFIGAHNKKLPITDEIREGLIPEEKRKRRSEWRMDNDNKRFAEMILAKI